MDGADRTTFRLWSGVFSLWDGKFFMGGMAGLLRQLSTDWSVAPAKVSRMFRFR